jgi:hypothetical protein
VPNTILGPDTTYAGGGGGGGTNPGGTNSAGGPGGGGIGVTCSNGSPISPSPNQNATANTGSGGGGGGNNAAGSGGSGVVVVRGPSAVAFAGSPCCVFTGSTHPGGDKIAKFTASGTLTVSLA